LIDTAGQVERFNKRYAGFNKNTTEPEKTAEQ
jgi:ribosomal protein L31